MISLMGLSSMGQTHSLDVQMNGFSEDGKAYIILFKEGAKFNAKCEDCIKREIQIEELKASTTFRGLKKGSYAILVYHDQNGNKELDTNFIGIPREGIGNSTKHMGIPSFRKCAFELVGDQDITIAMVYL